jgi:hypothetical protein
LENKVVIDYQGIVQYETIGELIHLYKHQVHTIGIQIGTYKKILLIMIESLENIMKHSECYLNTISDKQTHLPVFTILKKPKQYVIISSNPIKKQNVAAFKNKLDHLNTLDQQGLKGFYKETITNGQFTNQGGAGLGLIEIAKISGSKIAYDFIPIDEQCDRFSMIITIDESVN